MSERKERRQFSAVIPVKLHRKVKRRAVDENTNVSALVEKALTLYLAQPVNRQAASA